MVYSVRKMLVKPRLGRRRCKGIWPPSKPRSRREPEREPWPLWPRVEVLPMPLPMPLPTRLRLAVAPLGGLNVDKFIGTLYPFLFTQLPAPGGESWQSFHGSTECPHARSPGTAG